MSERAMREREGRRNFDAFFEKLFIYSSSSIVSTTPKNDVPPLSFFLSLSTSSSLLVNGQCTYLQKKRQTFFSLARFARCPPIPHPTHPHTLFSSFLFPPGRIPYRTSNAATLARAVLLDLDPPFSVSLPSLPARFSFAAAIPFLIAPPAPEAAVANRGCSSS